MDIRSRIRKILRENYGEFKTHLEHIYEDTITEHLVLDKDKEAWATYNQVVIELKHSIKDNLRVKELQYKLTENSDPNIVCIEVIKKVKKHSPELERLYHKIKNFI